MDGAIATKQQDDIRLIGGTRHPNAPVNYWVGLKGLEAR
jgi:hypothetical protein